MERMERERMERPPMDRELDMRARAMELEEREAEVHFQQQMREIELDERRAEMERHFRERPKGPGGAIFLAVCLIVNILLTVWVYQDMRQRNAGSGLWIPIVLLSGFLGALVYAVVRLGDVRQEKG
jgi:hypothetical protein